MRVPLDDYAASTPRGRWGQLFRGPGYRYLRADVDVRQWQLQETMLL